MQAAFTPDPEAGAQRFGIITGAASGIGKAAALHLAGQQAGVALVDLQRSGLDAAQEQITQTSGSPVLSFAVDVSDEAGVKRLVEETAETFGRIDFLINAAGILRRTAFTDLSAEEWDLMLRVNLRAPFLACKYTVPWMIHHGRGVIVNVASLAGRTSSILGGAHYTAAKHGLIGLTRHLARELGPSGLRINAFCPGATLTPMTIHSTSPEEIEAVKATIPRRRWASPEEQAAVIGFLVSDAAVNISGACIDSNGGALMI